MPVNLVLLNAYKFASIIQTDWIPKRSFVFLLLRHQTSQTFSTAGIPSHKLSYMGPKQWKPEAKC